MKKRNFSIWLSGFRDSIADYGYYIDFEKVHKNVNNIKIELNILNSLIGSKNIENDFEKLTKKYPEVLKCIPLLLAVRANEISVKEQNVILKFLEEPLKNSYILMLCERTEGLLPTIVNRCQMWALQNYSRDTLKSFLTVADERILDIVDTPGLIISLQSHDFDGMIELADKIVGKIAVASIPNTLTLSNKLAFKNEKDKFDVSLFMRILSSRISEAWKTTSNIKLITAHNLTSELQHKLNVSNVDKKALFEKYLIDLRTCMRGSIL